MKHEEEPVIAISGLWMNYTDRMVLRGIDLKVYRGQIIGYIGPNGAGKSTTVKIMLGLVEGYNGKVEIFGKDITEGDVSYKRRIGYVPEVAELYDSLTAREYLSFVGELYGMNRTDADDKAERLMGLLGLEKSYDVRISSYSKGMKQKVLLISSMLHDPDILFLDEPLSGLDANSVMVVKEIFASLAAKGKTIFYSSHIMDVVEKISSRIILINGGEIVADGTFAQLKEKSREGSLEEIFNQLTGFDKYRDIAGEFVAVIQGGDSHE
ncbi:ABC transporter ATP-binding protein [Paenibacillus albidus]|uniref:ABC transporter ATP-binding protein n=1 Tax=Paenibacillus albidus TaxID=2041023 RepID=A0A917FRY9_9BACL|nr:ABC transporter ATP-binding protein [Paenibacillus albidus]GGF97464.1 ABC transporter ATP-binding protein [Paenibacillus albidus]